MEVERVILAGLVLSARNAIAELTQPLDLAHKKLVECLDYANKTGLKPELDANAAKNLLVEELRQTLDLADELYCLAGTTIVDNPSFEGYYKANGEAIIIDEGLENESEEVKRLVVAKSFLRGPDRVYTFPESLKEVMVVDSLLEKDLPMQDVSRIRN